MKDAHDITEVMDILASYLDKVVQHKTPRVHRQRTGCCTRARVRRPPPRRYLCNRLESLQSPYHGRAPKSWLQYHAHPASFDPGGQARLTSSRRDYSRPAHTSFPTASTPHRSVLPSQMAATNLPWQHHKKPRRSVELAIRDNAPAFLRREGKDYNPFFTRKKTKADAKNRAGLSSVTTSSSSSTAAQ
jgi:hypothetical protein